MLGRPRLEPGTYGSISVRVRESGSYFAEARVRDWDGRVRKVAASHADEDEAILALKKRIARQLQITDPGAEITGQTPFPALTRNWLVDLKLDSQLSDGTKEVYENELRTLVMPAFEQCIVSDLTAVRIERFLKVQRAKSYTKAKHSKVLLSLLIRYAMLHGALGHNPLLATSPLRRPKVRRKALTIEEIDAIRKAASVWGDGPSHSGPKPGRQLGDVIEVMLGGATRIGEALGLRRCDVDLTAEPPTIHICGTIVVRNEKGTYRQPFPKTVTSDRIVAIPEFTAKALRASLAMHDDQDPEQLVFLTRRGTPVSPFNVRRSFRQILQLAGLADQEVKLHTLRKAAAMLVSRHAGDEVAAEMLGHSGTQTLRRHYLAHTREPNPVTAEILERFAPGVSSPALAEITRST